MASKDKVGFYSKFYSYAFQACGAFAACCLSCAWSIDPGLVQYIRGVDSTRMAGILKLISNELEFKKTVVEVFGKEKMHDDKVRQAAASSAFLTSALSFCPFEGT